MSVKSIRSNFALTVSICVGVATLGFCSVIPLASSVRPTNVVVHPLSVKGLSSTTLDDPAVSNVERSSFADCGVSNVNRMADGKIVGGVETAPNEFPWQAYLQVELESGSTYSCAGSLVSERWILTSAGCVTEKYENTQSILVYLGLHNRSSSSTETTSKMYEGQGLLVHDQYDPYTNNIALIYLSTTVTFTQYIRPACLADPVEPSYLGKDVTITGWGTTSDAATSGSEVLRKVTVPVISNSQCQSYYGDITGNTGNTMCTSGANGSGPCAGDLGGPLNFKQPDGTWKQIGIGSVRSGICQMGYPTVYTRLSSYSTWVQQIIVPGSDFSTTPLMFRTTPTRIETTPTTTPTASTDAPTDAPTEATTEAPTDAPTTTQTITQSTSTKSPTTTSTETTVRTTQKTTTPTTEATTTPTTTTSITNPSPTTFSCAGKANGNYPNPESSCSNTFYTCSNGNAYLFNCASDLVYREEIGVCDYPSNVAGCH